MSETNKLRRAQHASKAWSEAMTRLCSRAGCQWPVGTTTSAPAVAAFQAEADAATNAYVDGVPGRDPRATLDAWERAMAHEIDVVLATRGCSLCGHEKVVEIVDVDGVHTCGRCRSGLPDAD